MGVVFAGNYYNGYSRVFTRASQQTSHGVVRLKSLRFFPNFYIAQNQNLRHFGV